VSENVFSVFAKMSVTLCLGFE